ncbi:MAG: SulP family inorganic anion transporter [Opitutales bacterium]
MKWLKRSWRQFRRGAVALARQNQLDLFPVRHQLKGYNPAKFSGDLRAGMNVALLAFPQGMAYALIAGLPIQYGIFGSAVAATVGAFFAGSRFIMLGPTNATSVTLYSSFAALVLTMGGSFTEAQKLVLLPMLVFLVGLFLVIGAYLRVANLIQYISRTVVTGYITAASVLIIANQVKNVLGISFSEGEEPRTFIQVVYFTALHLQDIVRPDAILFSIVTAVIFYGLNWKLRALPNVAITLVVMSVASYLTIDVGEFAEVKRLTAVSASDWKLTIPNFDIQQMSLLAGTAGAIALLCVLEGMSIGRSLAARAGQRLDANQEMLNIGLANISCGLLNGMPASGSLTRSALGFESGATTSLASLYCGLMVALGVLVVGELTQYIPQASLAVLVIVIGLSLIKIRTIRVSLKSTRSDAASFLVTFLGGLVLPLSTAIYLGVAVSLILFLRKVSTPELVEYTFTEEGELAERDEGDSRLIPQLSIVHVEGDLFFGAAEVFQTQLQRVCLQPNLKIIVIKLRNARHLDATAVMALEELVADMQRRDRHLILSEAKKDVVRVMRNSGMLDVIGRENIFPDNPRNPTLSTANALKRAQEILGDEEANIRIFVNPKKRVDGAETS